MKRTSYHVLILILNVLSLILLTIICIHLNIIDITYISNQLSHDDKINYYIDAYAKLKERLDTFLRTESELRCIEEFDLMFTNYQSVSKSKKIDFYLWNLDK